MTTLQTQVSIFGSCVSRDTVAALDQEVLSLQRYIARQSLISAFGAPVNIAVDISALSSAFQRRMVRGDLDSSFSVELPKIAEDSEILLWDLVDERFGVYQLASGAHVTRSLELINSGVDTILQREARFIPFGSDEHLSRWSDAFQNFTALAETLDLTRRTKLLVLPWANRDNAGRKLRTHNGLKPSRVEKIFERYYAVAQKHITIVRPTFRSRPLSPHNHRWGAAAYHYHESVYRSAASCLFS